MAKASQHKKQCALGLADAILRSLAELAPDKKIWASKDNPNLDDLFLSLIRPAAEQPGAKLRMADRITELTGRSVTRDMVRLWLRPDEPKRRQPSLFYGLVLLAVGYEEANREPTL